MQIFYGNAVTHGSRRGQKLTAGVPLTKLIRRKLTHAPEIVMLRQPRSVAAEQFHRLARRLAGASEPQVVAVTSASPGEGKSVVAVNLGLALARLEQGPVLLLDADARQSVIGNWMTPRADLGLSEILLGQTDLEHVVIRLDNTALEVIPAGDSPHDPVQLFSSEDAGRLMAELRNRFWKIVIDTPPIIPYNDANEVGALTDGFLVVARARQTSTLAYRQAVESITSAPVLGCVLNGVPSTGRSRKIRSRPRARAREREA